MYSTQVKIKEKKCSDWCDLGHMNTYYKTRALFTTERAFNSLRFEEGMLIKKGLKEKIKNEAEWYKQLPMDLKKYAPNYYGMYSNGSYAIEYIYGMPLSELFVFGKKDKNFWNKILKQIESVFRDFSSVNRPKEGDFFAEYKDLIIKKTKSRMESFSLKNNLGDGRNLYYGNDPLGNLDDIVENCIQKCLALKPMYGFMHGDLCFSNILYDSRSDTLKIIDPRATNGFGGFSNYGNMVYDIAKVFHSIFGLYDFILAKKYIIKSGEFGDSLKFDNDVNVNLPPDIKILGMSMREIYPVVVLLFLSMLPLHSDDSERQQALFLNALRLYFEYEVRL